MGGLNRKWRRKDGDDDKAIKRSKSGKLPPIKHWEEQEAIGAASHKGRRTKGSGSTWKPDEKLDSVGNTWRMSNKTTTGGATKSIRFERAWLEEAKRAALPKHQPCVMFGFDPDAGDQREDWVAIPVGAFKIVNAILIAVEERGRGGEARALLYILRRAT